ncbi:hypothetical protein AALO_G00238200 [Alosa alosa]|uniref:Myb/SANT-like DNA-binding domain-containing protein n=1 Tax=Alosa alosa TaxID=278164 RepID=A0AAV6FVT9_9TELE|nr:uncharacterized protein LOC125311714 isoform X2 [Alosa alosa]KAG5266958.1 hypothetical protein AALO_G00238200 [Alosa alosa]
MAIDKPPPVHFWSDAETEFMLCQLKALNILKYMDGRKTRNGNLFRKVAEHMEDAGFQRTSEQIRVRWKNVKKAYYNTRKKNQTSGNSSVSCPYSNILKELLGRRPLSKTAENGVDIVSNVSPSFSDQEEEQQFAGDQAPLEQDPLPHESSDSYLTSSPTSEPSSSTSLFHQQFQIAVKAEAPEGAVRDSPISGTPNGELPRRRSRLSLQPGTQVSPSARRTFSIPTRFTSLSPFEEQLLAVHREQAAAIREGFRSLAQQNRLLYLEVCETNRSVARIASAVAEKAASSSGMAEELIRVQQRISESIDSTNNLHTRVIDLLFSQQEQPIIVMPNEDKGMNVRPSRE